MELISRFGFDFFVVAIFLNDSNFWCVQSSITCNENVHVLWPVCTPHNAISNVVVSLTIHDNIFIYKHFFIRDAAKNMKHCGRSMAFFKCLTCKSFVILGFLCLSLCVCLCLCVLCVVVVVVVEEGGEEENGRD